MAGHFAVGRFRMIPGSKGAGILSFACIVAGSVCLLPFTVKEFQPYFFLSKSFVFSLSAVLILANFLEGERFTSAAFTLTGVASFPYPVDSYTQIVASGMLSSMLFFLSAVRISSRGSLPPIPEKDLAIIRAEYMKAEILRKQAEEELRKAQADRVIAEMTALKAKERLDSIRSGNGNVQPSALDMAYENMGVHETDSDEAVKEIYFALARVFHPDKYSRAGDLSQRRKTQKLAQVNSDYDVIMRHRGRHR